MSSLGLAEDFGTFLNLVESVAHKLKSTIAFWTDCCWRDTVPCVPIYKYDQPQIREATLERPQPIPPTCLAGSSSSNVI